MNNFYEDSSENRRYPDMMNIRLITGLGLAGALLLSLPASASAQKIAAMTALDRVGKMHGDRFVSRIVSMRGKYGQTQPTEWRVVVHDPKSPTLLREFWIGDTRATDEGANNDYYPKQTPPGFIPFRNIRLDSVDAFELLNKEAMRAKIGFDSINYFLRCREFSNEPIWTLQAVNEDGNITGIVDISAETAKVLRMTWIYPNASGTLSDPKVIDSDLNGGSARRTQVTIENRNIEPEVGPTDPLADPNAPMTLDPLDPVAPVREREVTPVRPLDPDIDGEVPEVIPLPDDTEIVKPRN